MQPIPYLFFAGNCRDAMEAYGRIFGNAPEIMAFGAMPEDQKAAMPGVPDEAVMHASVKVGDGWVYASDDFGGDTPAMAGCNVTLNVPGEAETKRIWKALAEGGEVRMALSPTFWTPLFGTLTDRFGVRWMIMQESDYQG